VILFLILVIFQSSSDVVTKLILSFVNSWLHISWANVDRALEKYKARKICLVSQCTRMLGKINCGAILLSADPGQRAVV
jgi:hypothetical protein